MHRPPSAARALGPLAAAQDPPGEPRVTRGPQGTERGPCGDGVPAPQRLQSGHAGAASDCSEVAWVALSLRRRASTTLGNPHRLPPLGPTTCINSHASFVSSAKGGRGRDALEGTGPRRRTWKQSGRRLEEVAKAVGGGYCRLQMALKLALAVRGTVAGHRLGALEREGGGYVPPFQCIPGEGAGEGELGRSTQYHSKVGFRPMFVDCPSCTPHSMVPHFAETPPSVNQGRETLHPRQLFRADSETPLQGGTAPIDAQLQLVECPDDPNELPMYVTTPMLDVAGVEWDIAMAHHAEATAGAPNLPENSQQALKGPCLLCPHLEMLQFINSAGAFLTLGPSCLPCPPSLCPPVYGSLCLLLVASCTFE